MMLGYSDTSKGYRVWNFELGKVECVRSVVFNEVRKSNFKDVGVDEQTSMPRFDDIHDETQGAMNVPDTPSINDDAVDMDTDEDMGAPSTQSNGDTSDPVFDIDDAFMESELDDDYDESQLQPRPSRSQLCDCD
jgi:hypothetical protein